MNRIFGGLLVTLALVCACNRSPQAQRDHFLANGKRLFAAKDYARASLEFKNAAQVMPKDAEAYYQLGLVSLASDDFTNAVAYFRTATQLDPKHAGAQLRLAELMEASGTPEIVSDAEKRVQSVLRLLPDDADALNTLALAEYKLGKKEDAETSLRRAFSQAPANIRTFINLAAIRLNNKDSAGAEKALLDGTTAAPSSPDAWVALGRFYVTTDRLADARRSLERAAAIAPSDPTVLMDLGRLYVTLSMPDKAEATFKQLSSGPDAALKTIYPLYLYHSGRKKEAIDAFKSIVTADPKNREARTQLVAAYVNGGNLQDAERILAAAIKSDHRDVEAFLQRGEVYLLTGRISAAEADAYEAIRYGPLDSRGHYLLARVYRARGDAFGQRQELTETLRLNPAALRARVELAEALAGTRAYQAALSTLATAPFPQNQSLPVTVERNWVLIASGDRTQARENITKSLQSGRNPDLLVQDGILKLQDRNFAGARASFEEVLRSHPEHLLALTALANSYFAEQNYSGGISKLKDYAAQHSEIPSVQLYLAEVLMRARDYAGARTALALTQSNASDPQTRDFGSLMIAQLDFTEGHADAAKSRLTAMLAANRGGEHPARMLGYIYQASGRFADAIPLYRSVVNANGNDWQTANNLAICLGEAGEHDEALQYARKAKELARDDASVTDTLGWAQYNIGLYQAAVASLEPLAGDANAVHQYHLAMAYLKSGKLKEGRSTLESAMKLDRNAGEAKKAMAVYAEVTQRDRQPAALAR